MEPIVQTSYGELRGTRAEGLHIFRGVPFARPPAGARRFRPPERPAAWAGVRDATRFGPAAPQSLGLLGPVFSLGITRMDEDCLSLNVWTPGVDSRRRPVLVWIHGGAFVLGAGSQSLYDGAVLARRGDVVVVTINYRLGSLGFLRLRELSGGRLPASGNEGLLDQIAALEWVRDEIAAFGGDPGNVTIFGESAGAMSCAALLGAPRARGLFHRAILQSGAANYVSPAETASAVAEEFLAALRIRRRRIADLLSLPPERLVEAQARLFFTLRPGLKPVAPLLAAAPRPGSRRRRPRRPAQAEAAAAVGPRLAVDRFHGARSSSCSSRRASGLRGSPSSPCSTATCFRATPWRPSPTGSRAMCRSSWARTSTRSSSFASWTGKRDGSTRPA